MTNSEIQEKTRELLRRMTGGSSLSTLGDLVKNHQYDDAILLVKRIPQTTSGSNEAKIAFIHLMKDAINGTAVKVEKPVPPITSAVEPLADAAKTISNVNASLNTAMTTGILFHFDAETGLYNYGETKFTKAAVDNFIAKFDNDVIITAHKMVDESEESEEIGFALVSFDDDNNLVATMARSNEHELILQPIIDGEVIDTDLVEIINDIKVEIIVK